MRLILNVIWFVLAGLCTVVKRPDAGAPSFIGNLLWLILAGWWLSIGHLITGVLLCVTIIGIPLGLGSFKMIPVCLWPFGREIVPIEQADDTAVMIGPSAAHPAGR